MKIRTKAILVIVLTNLVIIALSISVGILVVNNDNTRSLHTDLSLIADIADHYLSNEIESIKVKTRAAARVFSELDDSQWPGFFAEQGRIYPEFTGLAVYRAGTGIIAAGGEAPAEPEAIVHVEKALTEGTALSSTVRTDDGTYFYAAAAVPGADGEMLIATLPALHFSRLLSEFRIWETGHIFITDTDGFAVSNPRENWVHDRFNYITIADEDETFAGLAETIKLMVRGDTGIGFYTLTGTGFSDTPRVCSYRPITKSAEGWSLGVVAPTTENPSRNTPAVLFLVGSIGLALNIVFAVFASNIIKKPYEQIVALKEAAEVANASKSNFLATMSHEIRSPLNIIVGLTNLRMEDGGLPDDIKEDIVKINNAGDVLLGIVNDILDFSKIEAGKITLSNSVYNTASVLNDIITLNMTRTASRPIKFIVEIDEGIPEELCGDELRIKQIFNNLLSNAFKYTDAGTVKLKVGQRKDEHGRIWLDISVSDTGIGIREKDIGRLFSDYSQVDADANRKIGGTGLGLAITRKLAGLMGGEISVQSEYGIGSTFRVSICQEQAGDAVLGADTVMKLCSFTFTDEKQHVSARLVRDDMSYARVLIVDDYAANLDVAAGMIRKYKITVDCVMSGKSAIDLIRGENPIYSAIFMDHMMPEMDGIEATKIIRNIGTEYARTIPIIALTANAIAGNEDIFLSCGFDAFLAKPIDMMELDTILRKWVREKSAEHAVHTAHAAHAGHPPAGSGTAEITINIPGIDTDMLKKRYQNDAEIILAALRYFPQSAAEAIETMRNVSEDTLDSYCISVHGIKGITANIYAGEISAQAAELEKMAKNGDIAGILEHNGELINKVSGLVDDVKAWLEAYNKSSSAPVLKAPDPAVLERLRKCCLQYDIEGADRAMEELESADYETGGELLAWLKEKMGDSKFEEIAGRLAH